jgi:hypothetical protein
MKLRGSALIDVAPPPNNSASRSREVTAAQSKTRRCKPQGDAELMTEKQVLGLKRWLDAHEYASIAEMCGSMSDDAVPDTNAYERGNYMKVLSSYTLKTGAFND